jgi:hypothetical protein
MFAPRMRTSTNTITAAQVVPVVRVEPEPGLLPDLPRSRAEIAANVEAGQLSLVSAEWTEGWDDALDDFPETRVSF